MYLCNFIFTYLHFLKIIFIYLHTKKSFPILFLLSYILAAAIRDMNEAEVITEAPKDCDDTGTVWETGKLLFE